MVEHLVSAAVAAFAVETAAEWIRRQVDVLVAFQKWLFVVAVTGIPEIVTVELVETAVEIVPKPFLYLK